MCERNIRALTLISPSRSKLSKWCRPPYPNCRQLKFLRIDPKEKRKNWKIKVSLHWELSWKFHFQHSSNTARKLKFRPNLECWADQMEVANRRTLIIRILMRTIRLRCPMKTVLLLCVYEMETENGPKFKFKYFFFLFFFHHQNVTKEEVQWEKCWRQSHSCGRTRGKAMFLLFFCLPFYGENLQRTMMIDDKTCSTCMKRSVRHRKREKLILHRPWCVHTLGDTQQFSAKLMEMRITTFFFSHYETRTAFPQFSLSALCHVVLLPPIKLS